MSRRRLLLNTSCLAGESCCPSLLLDASLELWEEPNGLLRSCSRRAAARLVRAVWQQADVAEGWRHSSLRPCKADGGGSLRAQVIEASAITFRQDARESASEHALAPWHVRLSRRSQRGWQGEALVGTKPFSCSMIHAVQHIGWARSLFLLSGAAVCWSATLGALADDEMVHREEMMRQR